MHNPRIKFFIGCLLFSLTLVGCVRPTSSMPTLIATLEGEPIYTPVATLPVDVALPSKVKYVSIEELVKNPQRYTDQFIEVHGVNEGGLIIPMVICWVSPPWQWRLAAGPTVYDSNRVAQSYPPGIDVKNTFGDMLKDISNAEGYTIRNPYGKRAAVWGWWRLYKGTWGCPQTNALGTPQPSKPHYYLDAVQLQFLEDIQVTPPTLYQPITAVVLKDGMLYVGEDSVLTIFDARNPEKLVQVSQVHMLGPVVDLEVMNRRAYVVLGRDNDLSGGLQVLDLSDPRQPTLIGSLLLDGAPADISVAGSFVYIANYELGLQIIDIRDPANLTLRGRYTPSGTAWSAQVVDQLVYLADNGYTGDKEPSSGLQIIDVSDPDHPFLLGSYPLEEGGRDVQVVGRIAYLAEEGNAVYILDVSDPSHLKLLGKYPLESEIRNLYVADNLVYLITFGEFSIIDVSDPASPNLRGKSHLWDGMDIQVSNNVAYVATWRIGFQVLDITDPNNPVLLSTYGILQP